MTSIYLSSTYSDLKEHREAAYRALRQMRYDVIAMEDYVATDQRPLKKCLTDVASCDLYIGLFAWRYGYIPTQENPEHKSITELEYRKASQLGKPCLIFLLDEDVPWPRKLTDEVTGEGNQGEYIKVLRHELAQEKIVSFFQTPEQLASLAGSAVHLWEKSQPIVDNSTSSALLHTKQSEARLNAMLADHSGFLRDRLMSFVGRQVELEEIRRCIAERLQTGGYVTITGQAGQGKSSIIAKLVEKYGVDSTVFHFIPFNPGPDHQVGLLRNVMARLILKYDLSDLYVASESRPALSQYFPKVLADLVEKGGQEVIFIDGLDQLKEDIDGERDLSFLPNDLPPGIVFVLGTRPDDALRPLKLLKPHDEYRLPNLSRQDFDLILEHRGARLERDLADEFYRAMQENALYLDLVAKELAEDGSLIPVAMMKRIADDPNNLFSLSMARLRRRHNQWREVIKPILGVLLVAHEPLSLRQIRQIIGVDDDALREGVERLGGLLAQDGQHRYYLFHLKLQDYLRQNEGIPEKEYVFATDEEEDWHKKLAQWCEQGNLLTMWQDVKHSRLEQRHREYGLRHYLMHLYQAQDWQRLFEVLDSEQYGRSKIRFDPSMHSYAQDLDLGRQAAAWSGWTLEEGIALLPRLWRYTLLQCGLTSRADAYSREEFEILMLLKHEQEALGLAELLTQLEFKASIFVLIGKCLERESGRRQEGLQLFMRAQEIARSVDKSEPTAEALGQLSGELARAQEWDRAEAVARIIMPGRARSEALWELGKALVQAQQWDRVISIVGIIEERWIKENILQELGMALVQAHQWERAEVIAYSLENPKERADVLRELGVALAQSQQWKQAEAVACSLKRIQDRVVVLQALAAALTDVKRWMPASAIWDEALALANRIKEQDVKIRILLDLGRTLTQTQQWGRAEAVWDEVLFLVHTVKVSKAMMRVVPKVIKTLVQTQQWERAEEVLLSIGLIERKSELLQELVKVFAQAQQWEKAEEIARSLQDTWQGIEVLRELIKVFAQAQQWEQAEEIARSLQDTWQGAEVLQELVKVFAQAQQWEKAEEIVRSLQDTWYGAEVRRELGIALAQAQQWEQAEEIAHSLQNTWYGALVLRELGLALAQAQQWEQAEEIAHSLWDTQQRVEVLRELGIALAQAHEWERAEQIACSLQDEQFSAEVWRELFKVLVQAQQWERAEQIARSLQDAQFSAEVWRELGIALARAQQWERAEQIGRSLGDTQEQAKVWRELVKVLAQAQQWERAEAIWMVALSSAHSLDVSKNEVEALRELVKVLVQAQQWEQAEQIARSVQDAQFSAEMWRELGVSLAQAHEWERAEWIARSLQDAQFSANVWRELGISLAQAHEWERAEKIARSLQDTQEQTKEIALSLQYAWFGADVWRELVKALAQAQQWERAEKIARSLQDARFSANVWQELGIALAQAQQWKRAEHIARSLQDAQLSANVWQELVKALAQAQQWEQAEKIARSLEEIGNEGEVLLALSKELLRMRRWDRAKTTIYKIRHDREKISALIDYIDQLANVNQLDEAVVLWVESVVIAHTSSDSKMKARMLREIASSLSSAQKNEYALHLVQRAWRLIDRTEHAIELLSLVTGFLPLDPQISMAFYESIGWVSKSLRN